VSAAVRGPRDANFYVIGLCGRGSRERLAAATFNIRVDPLGTRFGTEQRRPVRSNPYRPVTAVVLWRAGEDWEAAVD